jgi:hypothetical protein
MIVLDKNTKKILMETFKTKNIGLEGNITKLIDARDDQTGSDSEQRLD